MGIMVLHLIIQPLFNALSWRRYRDANHVLTSLLTDGLATASSRTLIICEANKRLIIFNFQRAMRLLSVPFHWTEEGRKEMFN